MIKRVLRVFVLVRHTRHIWQILCVLVASLGFGFYFVSCNQLNLLGQRDYSAFASLPDWDADEHAIPNDKFFYVRIKPRNAEGRSLRSLFYELDGGVGTDCKIPIEQESSEDVFCMLEKTEADLWAHSTPLEYNVPPGMCHYLSFRVHWHWNQNAGRGPTQICKYETGDEENNETRYYVRATDDNCSRKSGGSAEIEGLCRYNLSTEEDSKLQNCCTGEYTVFEHSEGLSIKVDGESGSWGEGDLSKCIGGLARVNWSETTDDGIPQTRIESAETKGVIGTYDIPHIDSFFGGARSVSGSTHYGGQYVGGPSFTVANYYEDLEEDRASNRPKFYTTTSLHGGDNLQAGYPYITWACLDDHFEVIHRIHLLIREWNSREEFTRFIESDGSRGDPDVVGVEGADCDYYDINEDHGDLQFSQCNDLQDADDWSRNTNGDATFPGVIYE